MPEYSGNVVVVRCRDAAQPAGVEVGYVDDTVRVLSRPYPRRFPGTATFVSDPETRRLVMTGTSDVGAGAKSLEVWVRAPASPVVSAHGLTVDAQREVPGGLLLSLTPRSSTWSLTVSGS